MRVNWGGVAAGAFAGLASGVIIGVVLLVARLADTDGFAGQAILLVVAFAAQMVAGFVAALLSPGAEALHGGLAALVLSMVVSVIAVATGNDPGIATLVISAVVAVILGTAGGVLEAAWQERREGAQDH